MFRIVNDPANNIDVDLHINHNGEKCWLEIRNDEWVIKKFVPVNSNRTNVIDIKDKNLIKSIMVKWLESQCD